MEQADRVAYLIAGYITKTLTKAEQEELDEWVTGSNENMLLFARLTDDAYIEKALKERSFYNADKATALLQDRIGYRKRVARTRRVYAIGIAACIVLLAGLFLLVPVLGKKAKTRDAVPAPLAATDLQPGKVNAILTLADGKQLVLDGDSGKVFHDGGLDIIGAGGVLSYEGEGKAAAYHTLTVPRGGRYQVVLPDGSKVWLNAGSSLTYPTVFTGKERRVRASGEAYFSVTHDATKPFHVDVDGLDIQVLGTEFNVDAYKEEGSVKTTLLKGSVQLTSGNHSVKIKPGEQAVQVKGALTVTDSVDTEEIIGWKEGLFTFRDEPIEKIMQQVGRWYNVDSRYEGRVTQHFNATIDRNVPVSKLLHLLELTNRVHFTVSNQSIIVKP